METAITYTRSPSAVALPILAALAIVSSTPPLIWHYKNRNTAACSLVFWIILVNFFNFANALIWPTDDTAHWYDGNVLCDIEVKLMGASNLGVVGALACIMRNLANVMDTDRTGLIPTRLQRRRQVAVDLLLCFGGPMYMIIIHYIVQPNRYYIFAISGCTPSYDNSWPSIVLVFIWSPILCLLDTYYCGLVIVRLHRYRQQFAHMVSSSSMNLNPSRFKRLFLISFTLIVIFFPVQFYIFYVNLSFPRIPYSWNLVHGREWWNIVMVPTGGIVAFDRWVRLGSGFLVFVFFGMGKDAVTMYRSWLCKIGLGKIFPDLERRDSNASSQATSSSGSRSWGSIISSRARLVFKKKNQDRLPTSSSSSTGSRNDSVTPEVLTPSPSDPKKQFFPMSSVSERSSSHSSETARIEKPLPDLPMQGVEPWQRFSWGFGKDVRMSGLAGLQDDGNEVGKEQQHQSQPQRSNSYVTASWTPDVRQFEVRRMSEPA
ncbi:MAG: a-factor receptor [Candelina mexicana]|nr:MAG: a-factor receptor [Candelina mexicana]